MSFRSILSASSAIAIATIYPGMATAAPGILSPADPLVVAAADGASNTCTLGFLFSGPDGYARGMTAAHCGAVGQKASTTSRQQVGTVIEHGKDDIALIDVATELRVFGTVPGIGEVRGVITPDEINRTQPLLCKRGIASGLTCGYLTSPAEDNYFVMSGGSLHGDSGSPVWAIDSSGSLRAAGIVSGVMDDGSGDVYVIPVSPYMTDWGLTISQ
ncbi:hypothetical protein GS896_25390 [Rhodococcus hoagii]|nr:hypothetical protein [Prescottella equi]MBM4574707.1 hypothetical protein [Prescottella equi]MBM4574909.1 hypothetical protein [Prescottella equi]MBM4654161.1 hypothetical protein [Prescottella equi]MBM4719633.1 hypothetical protein [Prescottella equi]